MAEESSSSQVDMFKSMTNFLQQEMRKIITSEVEKFKKEFEPKMKEIVAECQRDLDNMMTKYYSERKQFAEKMNDNLNKQTNNKLIELRKKLDLEIGNIENELFNDPKSLLQQIKEESKKLKYQRKAINEEQKNWGKNEQKIARYLGFGGFGTEEKKNDDNDNDDEKKYDNVGGLDDDEELYRNYDNIKSQKGIESNKGEDWITINVDGRIFGTYRSTLTQVKGSVLELMFSIRSDMMHRDNEGIYYLDRNSDVFAEILEILRRRGAMPSNFDLTPEVQAELMELGLDKAFFKEELIDTQLLFGGIGASKVLFQTYRSTSSNGNYVKWNKAGLQSNKKVKSYFHLDKNDDSTMIIKKTGWYRLASRIVIRTNTSSYATIVINGSHKHYCYHYGYSSQHYKSYSFNEILSLKQNDKLQIYSSQAVHSEQPSSYLCLETIPSDLLSKVGVYTSTSSTSNYRVWNNVIKSSNNYSMNSYHLQFKQSGLYRVSARVHTRNSTAQQAIYMLIYKNGGNNNRSTYNYESCSSGSTQYRCFNFDEIVEMNVSDYIDITDQGYSTSNTSSYESINIEPIISSGLVGSWHSSSQSSNIRVWNQMDMHNPMLFEVTDNRTKILIKQSGYYRIGCMVTNSNNGDGYAAMYINGSQYCLSRMGVYGGTYYHTLSIQEILKLNKKDKIHVYCSHPYNACNYNTLFIERVIT